MRQRFLIGSLISVMVSAILVAPAPSSDDIQGALDAAYAKYENLNEGKQHKGKEINPFVNPGAIATTSMVKGANADEIWSKIIGRTVILQDVI